MRTPAAGSCSSASAAERAPPAPRGAGGWGRPWSHIGAATTWSAPNTLALGPQVLGDARLELGAAVDDVGHARPRAAGATASPTGTLPMAMRSPRDPGQALQAAARAVDPRARAVEARAPGGGRGTSGRRRATGPPGGRAPGSRCGRRTRRRSRRPPGRRRSRAVLATWSTPAHSRVEVVEVDRGRDDPLLDRQGGQRALDAAGGAQAVAVHRLGRRHHRAGGHLVAQRQAQGAHLVGVADRASRWRGR